MPVATFHSAPLGGFSMSLFRRKDEPASPATPGTGTTVPAARDPDLAVPPFRAGATPMPTPAAASGAKPAATPTQPVSRPGAPVVPAANARGPQRTESGERRTLVVGKGISLQGTVSDAERLVVEGTVESQMIVAQELQITHSGVCKGELQVEDAEIAGTFDGSLTANGNLIIRATGRVLGMARCRRLQVEEGGQISGKMEMITDGAAAPRALGPAPVRTEAADA